MHIVGHGFLAHSMAAIVDRHADVVVLAAGVSSGNGGLPAEYAREEQLLHRVLSRCRPGQRLVFFSTATAGMYGGPGSTGREDGPVYPTSSYARHKLALESTVAASTVDHVILRLAHTVGSRQRAHQLLPSLVRQIRRGTVTVHRGAHRDLIDVIDVVAIADALLTAGISRETVNVASGVAVRVENIIQHVESRLGVTATKEYLDRSDHTSVSTEKLARLVPAVAAMGFGEEYFRRAIDRHIGAVAASIVDPGDLCTAFPGLAPSSS